MIELLEKKIRALHVNMYALCEYDNGKWSQIKIQESNEKNNVYSVSKSITATIAGILIGEGKLKLSDCVVDILGDYCVFPDWWKNVTVEHLLTHTTGQRTGCLDIDTDGPEEWTCDDYLEVAAAVDFAYPAGEKMVYSDSNYYLLSRIITEKSGRLLQDLAREKIFNPLHIAGASWATCNKGYAMGATGLFLSEYDMAKIGVLWMQKGVWEGKQLVPASWIDAMKVPRITVNGSRKDRYGYGVWMRSDVESYWASGMLGQMIYISPENNRVVAWQSCTGSAAIGVITEELIRLDQGK